MTAAPSSRRDCESGRPVPRIEWLREALREALCTSPVSAERVRAVIVRFATAAREWASGADDVVAAVQSEAHPYLEQLPSDRRAELSASMQWWAVHGFHRAD